MFKSEYSQIMRLRLFARDAFKRWLKTLHKSTDLNGSDIQDPSSLMLAVLSKEKHFFLYKMV